MKSIPCFHRFFIFFIPLLLFTACKPPTRPTYPGLAKFFEENKVQGSFSLYDLKQDRYILSDPSQFNQTFSPASTFKICNSLISLETGVVADENTVLRWDGKVRGNPAWNKDQDMKEAFKNSTVWFYQELARRMEGSTMKHWLDKVNYGNADTSGGKDKFWLSGGLRISPNQQIDFLQRLYSNLLPFSQRTIDIVKKLMIVEQTPEYTLRAKTGRGQAGNTDIGWYVGYLEKKEGVYFFATCIQNMDTANPAFPACRIEITRNILRHLKLL